MAQPLISIIIPTLNERENLKELLAGLPRDPKVEVMVADGGSTDGTPEVAARFPRVQVLSCARGRGRQMNAGAL
ncbi:MAG: glycosyltransferase, partial [Deltaproteobacteria bacterium]|nr:glycosyltransferase [Deltaproteobacteria bacterium]